MYKKCMMFTALLCTLSVYASNLTPWLEIKPSYFFFSSAPMNAIYDHGGFQVQAAVSTPIGDSFDVYGSIGYRRASGYALNTLESTVLNVMPIDIGIKPVFHFSESFNYFLAVGPRYFYFNQQNNSSFVDPIISGSGLGLFVNTGFNLLVADSFLLGIFGEYSYENKPITSDSLTVSSHGSVQLGGFAFGVSLGYAF